MKLYLPAFDFRPRKTINYCLLLMLILQVSEGIKWLSLGKEHIIWDSRNRALQCRLSRRHHGLAAKQVRTCVSTFEAMPQVVKAAEQTMEQCQTLFTHRRWNCTSVLTAPNFTPDLSTGTREQAYVFALSSASLAYTLSKACAAGRLFNCSCAGHPKDLPSGNFKWGGCGDNVRWALQFGKHSIEMSLRTQCKCHGVSGSCSIKICWRALPKFVDIGARLMRKYTASVEVTARKLDLSRKLIASRKSYTENDLVYVSKSPDYCLRDDRTGSFGTRGRSCNTTSPDYDSCDVMCCGRGHVTKSVQKVEMCRCKFHWCCNVVCKKCVNWVDTHVCN